MGYSAQRQNVRHPHARRHDKTVMITKPSALKARFIPKPTSMSRAFSAGSQSIKDPGALPQAGIEAAPLALTCTADLTIGVCEKNQDSVKFQRTEA